ncbi:MAG: hypothetical protein ACM31C_19640, partial [Acidobacteriota bacterium]
LALLGADATRWDYVRQLRSTYGFEAPLEAALAYTPGLKRLLDLRARTRAGLIAQDLLALGMSASELALLPQCFPIAPFSGPVEALGWLYVTERATLLHESIRRAIATRIPDAPGACAYLSAYEGLTSARWQQLGRVLDRAAETPRALGDLVTAANAGFRCLLAWRSGSLASVAQGA